MEKQTRNFARFYSCTIFLHAISLFKMVHRKLQISSTKNRTWFILDLLLIYSRVFLIDSRSIQ